MTIMAEEQDASPQSVKRRRIMDAAIEVVMRYGFKRMTMDDVAKEAGISRPALYLVFKNKTDIYRAIAQSILGEALVRADMALRAGGSVESRLFAAVKTGILDPTDFLLSTSHGAELLDMKHTMAAEDISGWRAKKAAMIASALESSGTAKAKGLSGQALADILLDGIEGLKIRARGSSEREAGARALVKLVAG